MTPPVSDPPPDPVQDRWWQPRFGISTLLFLTFLCAIVAAVAGAWKRFGFQPGTPANAFFVLLVVGAPFFVMMLMSAYHWLKWAIEQIRR